MYFEWFGRGSKPFITIETKPQIKEDIIFSYTH